MTSPQRGYGYSSYGRWSRDAFDLPAFRLRYRKRPAMYHQVGSKRVTLILSQLGDVRFLTADHGITVFNQKRNTYDTGGYGVLHCDGGKYSTKISASGCRRRAITWGMGYASYRVLIQEFLIENLYFCPWNDDAVCFHRVTIRNLKTVSRTVRFQEKWAVNPQPSVPWRLNRSPDGTTVFHDLSCHAGRIMFLSALDPVAKADQPLLQSPFISLSTKIRLKPGEEKTLFFTYGYGPGKNEIARLLERYRNPRETYLATMAFWKRCLEIKAPAPWRWVSDEVTWNSYYNLSSTLYDAHVKEHFIPLGGYSFGNPDDINHYPGQNIRDIIEHTLPVIYVDKELARSYLRFAMKMQKRDGTIQKEYFFGDKPRFAGEDFDPETDRYQWASDTEIWLPLAVAEYVYVTRDFRFLNRSIAFQDGGRDTVYSHVKRSILATIRNVGYGAHGLIKFRSGDWDDYYNRIGVRNEGESVMNSALASFSWTHFIPLARRAGDQAFVLLLKREIARNRRAVDRQFDGRWYVRALTDSGRPVGDSKSGRLFLVAQAYAVLGRCSRRDKLECAIDNTLKKSSSPLGLLIISKPLPSPPSPDITEFDYSRGEGENAGIWPQQNDMFALALAREGMMDQAWRTWLQTTLRNHSRLHPEIWYGTWCMPDCYNSYYSGKEGCTQSEMCNRETYPVMTPVPAFKTWTFLRFFLEPGANGLSLRQQLPPGEWEMTSETLSVKTKDQCRAQAGRTGCL